MGPCSEAEGYIRPGGNIPCSNHSVACPQPLGEDMQLTLQTIATDKQREIGNLERVPCIAPILDLSVQEIQTPEVVKMGPVDRCHNHNRQAGVKGPQLPTTELAGIAEMLASFIVAGRNKRRAHQE